MLAAKVRTPSHSEDSTPLPPAPEGALRAHPFLKQLEASQTEPSLGNLPWHVPGASFSGQGQQDQQGSLRRHGEGWEGSGNLELGEQRRRPEGRGRRRDTRRPWTLPVLLALHPPRGVKEPAAPWVPDGKRVKRKVSPTHWSLLLFAATPLGIPPEPSVAEAHPRSGGSPQGPHQQEGAVLGGHRRRGGGNQKSGTQERSGAGTAGLFLPRSR